MEEFKHKILEDGWDKAGLMAVWDVVQRPTLLNEASDRVSMVATSSMVLHIVSCTLLNIF